MNNAQLTKEVKELKDIIIHILMEISQYGQITMTEANELLEKISLD
jgi:hypothetical protein